jgi:hypothetical protein
VVSVEHRLQGIGTVAQEMPTVGDLERLRACSRTRFTNCGVVRGAWRS